jgi:excinuclease ABC subunit C
MIDARSLLAGIPGSPGIYRMLDAGKAVLYVGKARNLRKRVASYFRGRGRAPKVAALMERVAAVDVTVTHTENEALLLENNLIKTLQPPYNILLRDDKSYPYIFVAETQEFPRIAFHRGAKREKGRYFGPYPSANAVRESLHLLQKVFPVRQCEDTFFRNRSRPCLQYQIKRCTGPCVGLIEPERYRQDVEHAILFLEGRSRAVVEDLGRKMEAASAKLDFERAAMYRDRIANLKHIQEKQYVVGDGGDADVLACVVHQDTACIEATFIRNGANLGSRAFFPRVGAETTAEAVLDAFLPQYYLGKSVPPRIYLNLSIPDNSVLADVFTKQAGRKTTLARATRGAPRRWVKMAELNAGEQLRRRLSSRLSLAERFEALRDAFAMEVPPERIECFDISHTMGEATVGSCVVFDQNGPVKTEYRRFNIEGIEPGDDYGAMTQALTRRYRRVKQGEGRLPDVLLIDGGKGQLTAAESVLQELGVTGGLRLVAVAKGSERKPGKEQLFLSGQRQPTILAPNSAALHLIQQVRDEAHRFAIAGHRNRRAKARTTSLLEQIPGIGDRRRQALLRSFGGLREVARAGVDDLAKVPGISRELAQRIYDTFHGQET